MSNECTLLVLIVYHHRYIGNVVALVELVNITSSYTGNVVQTLELKNTEFSTWLWIYILDMIKAYLRLKAKEPKTPGR